MSRAEVHLNWRTRLRDRTAKPLPGAPAEIILFVLLLMLAAVLRTWNLAQMDFMHDELSALYRLFPTWGETLRTGVVALDTHPPGVQLFEWCWTKVFGQSEAVVKIPFVFFSLVALVFLYRTLAAWNSTTSALCAVALLATIQYFVLYGQLARPYAIGLCTTAWAADALTRYLARARPIHALQFALAAVASAYIHHFAALQTAIFGLSGLLLSRADQRRTFALACCAACLLYLPNASTTLHQLGQGGLGGWLQAPKPIWWVQYASWLGHHTLWFVVPLAGLLIISVTNIVRHLSTGGREWLVLVSWGLVPMAIGYAYSVWRAPLLQYSVLLFAFPYLLGGLLRGCDAWPLRRTTATVATLSTIGATTLIHHRRHFSVCYTGKYAAMVHTAAEISANEPGCLTVFAAPDHIIRRYAQRTQLGPYVQLHEAPRTTLAHVLDTTTASTVVYGYSNGEVQEDLLQLQQRFPYMRQRQDLADGQCFVLDKHPEHSMVHDLRRISKWQAGQVPTAWQVNEYLPFSTDSVGRHYQDLSKVEFGLLYETALADLELGHRDRVEFTARVEAPEGTEVCAVLEVRAQDSTYHYACTGALTNMPVHFLATVLVPKENLPKGAILRAYIWNRSMGPLHIYAARLNVRKGNAIQYAFFEPVGPEGPWEP
jgi:Dolichyl-phosphate-mannose-protein mannosyltransferase